MTLNRLQQSCNSKCSFDIYSKNIGMNGSSVNINGVNKNGTLTGSIMGDMAVGGLETGMNIFAALMMSKMASGNTSVGGSSKNISNTVSRAITELPTKIANNVSAFNVKFGTAGLSIDSQGNVKSDKGTAVTSFDGYKNELKAQISKLKNSTVADQEKGTVDPNYQAYSNMKMRVTNLESAQQTIASYTTQMENFDKSNIKITNGKAEPRELNQAEIDACKQRCEPGKESDYQNTNYYKDLKEKFQVSADAYNNLATKKDEMIKTLVDKDGNKIGVGQLSQAITDAKAELAKLGAKDIGTTGKKCAAHDADLAALESKLEALGEDGSSFDACVKEIKQMSKMLSDALVVRKEETDVDEANTVVKRNKKGGSLFNKLFGKKTAASKAARADRKVQVQERDAAYRAFAERYMKDE